MTRLSAPLLVRGVKETQVDNAASLLPPLPDALAEQDDAAAAAVAEGGAEGAGGERASQVEVGDGVEVARKVRDALGRLKVCGDSATPAPPT